MDTRQHRQAKQDAKIAKMRAKAERLRTEAAKIRASLPDDYAYWSQPIAPGGRRRHQTRLDRAMQSVLEAEKLEEDARFLEATPVRVAGDAAKEKEVLAAALDVSAGDMVEWFGRRYEVVKVNRKTVRLNAATGPMTVQKHLVSKVA